MKKLAMWATGAGVSPAALVDVQRMNDLAKKLHDGSIGQKEQADLDQLRSEQSSGKTLGKFLDAHWEKANAATRALLGGASDGLKAVREAALVGRTGEDRAAVEKALPQAPESPKAQDPREDWRQLRAVLDEMIVVERKMELALPAVSPVADPDARKAFEEARSKWMTRKSLVDERLAILAEFRRSLEVTADVANVLGDGSTAK